MLLILHETLVHQYRFVAIFRCYHKKVIVDTEATLGSIYLKGDFIHKKKHLS